jgi:hypothetical protein
VSRGLAAGNVTASQASHVRPVLFVELRFDSGTSYLHNALGSYTWGGHTWLGYGSLGSVGAIEEGDDLSPYAVQLTLSGVDSTLLTIAQGTAIFERRVIIYIGFINDAGALTADPDELWSGSMEHMTISLGGGMDSITLQAESELIAHSQANGTLFTDEDQQKRHPGDTFFEFLSQIQNARIQWGPNATGGTNNVAQGSVRPGYADGRGVRTLPPGQRGQRPSRP